MTAAAARLNFIFGAHKRTLISGGGGDGSDGGSTFDFSRSQRTRARQKQPNELLKNNFLLSREL